VRIARSSLEGSQGEDGARVSIAEGRPQEGALGLRGVGPLVVLGRPRADVTGDTCKDRAARRPPSDPPELNTPAGTRHAAPVATPTGLLPLPALLRPLRGITTTLALLRNRRAGGSLGDSGGCCGPGGEPRDALGGAGRGKRGGPRRSGRQREGRRMRGSGRPFTGGVSSERGAGNGYCGSGGLPMGSVGRGGGSVKSPWLPRLASTSSVDASEREDAPADADVAAWRLGRLRLTREGVRIRAGHVDARGFDRHCWQ